MNSMIPAWVDGDLQPVEKLFVHREGLKHKAVSVFVVRGSDILIQQRALNKYHTPGLWANTCCTHPNWNEDPKTCAVRRLREELGISGLAPQWRHNLEYRADVGGGLLEHEVVDVFVVNVTDDLIVTENPDEVMATRWIPYPVLLSEIEQFPDRFTPWLKIYLKDHVDVIFGSDLDMAANQ